MSATQPITEPNPPPIDLTAEETSRMWEHLLHEDNLLNDRVNLFFVSNALLLAMVGSLLTAQNLNHFLLIVFTGAGCLLGVIWSYVQARQLAIKKVLESQAKNLREYSIFLSLLGKSRLYKTTNGKKGLASSEVLAKFLPGVMIALWGILLVYAVGQTFGWWK